MTLVLNALTHVGSFIAVCLLVSLGSVPCVRADWINLSGAETSRNIVEIYVEEDRVRVVLEAFISDLDVFRDLVPDPFLKRKKLAAGRLSLSERMRRFSSETLRIETATGEKLQATALKIEPRLRKDRKSAFAGMINPFTRRRVPDAPADKRVLYAELSYAFPVGAPPPETLTITPPLDKQGRARVTIGFIAYHKSVPVIDFRYLGAAAKVNLNWNDPWYTKFDNPNLKRHHKDALMSFLYVEPREVRHEVLIRVRDLQEWTDLGLKGGGMIGSGEQTSVKERARRFFEAHNPMRIGGKPFKPTSSRAEFLNISLRGLQVIEEDNPLDSSTAILGIILSYPVKQLPKNVSVRWELFNPRIVRIPTTATDPAGPYRSFIDAENPTIAWQNFLRKFVEPKVAPVEMDSGRSFGVPVVSLILVLGALIAIGLVVRPRYFSRYSWAGAALICVVGAGLLMRATVVEVRNPFAGPPAEAVAAKIITAVLDNVHTAYLERTEPELTQALSVVVAEGGYSDVKTELSRALAIKVAGGGIARVTAIKDLQVKEIGEIGNGSGFRSVAEWTALASAGHWGHAHRRRIRFRALMELEEIEGAWKLTGLTIVDARRES
jgi:hypothetical protein